jgi:hypothetical protein
MASKGTGKSGVGHKPTPVKLPPIHGPGKSNQSPAKSGGTK